MITSILSKDNFGINITYSHDFEELLKQEAERSEAMSILHEKSYKKYNRLSMLTNIPVIVISGIIGFLAPINLFDKQDIFLGSLSVLCGMIKRWIITWISQKEHNHTIWFH